MGANKKDFDSQRERLLMEEREVGKYPPFDHDGNFKRKVQENWLTTEDMTRLQSADLFQLTEALTKKMDSVDYERIIEMIKAKEPKYITGDKGLEYIKLISKTPIDNMKRVFNKYDGIDFFIKANLKHGLELLILNHG